MKRFLMVVLIALTGCTVWDIYPIAHGGGSPQKPKDEPVTYSPIAPTIKWEQLAVDGFTEVYRSDDGRWQIEPAHRNAGSGWCLLDRGKHPITAGEDFDYVQCGTLAEMKMQAESLKAWRP